MEITIQETIAKKVEITLPHYVKSIAHFYKVVSEKDCIQVYIGDRPSIGIHHAGLAFSGEVKESNEGEFNEAFQLAMDQLNIVKNETI